MATGPRIYKSGDFIWLVFDQSLHASGEHSISIPISDRGWEILLYILSVREGSPFVPKEHIAQEEAPIQYMIEQWLKDGGQIKRPKQDAKETLTLEDLDL